MTDNEKIERALAGIRGQSGGRAESECVSRQAHPERETRPQAEKERHPDYYTRQQDKGRSR
jgi:hypothetical protein